MVPARHTAAVRIPPSVILRGAVKFLAVVIGAGLAGAAIGIGLAALTNGSEEAGLAVPPTSTTVRTSPTAAGSRTTR